MTDRQIVDLFFERSQRALEEVRSRYGEKLHRLACNILRNSLDAEESVNDALLIAWRRIPPERPDPLFPWLCAVTRNISLNRYRVNSAQKRGFGDYAEPLSELQKVADGGETPDSSLDHQELVRALNGFLDRLSRTDRTLFLGRYFSGESYFAMAERLGMTENTCQVRVSRLRKKLKAYLKKEGVL